MDVSNETIHANAKEENRTSVISPNSQSGTSKRVYEMIYVNVISIIYLHIASVYGIYISFTSARWETIFLNYILYILGGLGITAGAHRLWTHRTYKAKLPLEIMLMLFNCISAQTSILHWARDHRLHHKYSDTDGDPYNASRGLFYSHVGWLMVKKHPEVIKRGKIINISDLTSNPVLLFQKKYSYFLISSMGFLIPTLIPCLFWEETLINSWHVTILRYTFTLNGTFAVNSVAHLWGYKPYDGRILPAQNILVSIVALGEAFHNYHHAFPRDYRTAELGNNLFNFTTKFIDFFALIGWAYDLKSASNDEIQSKMKRTGDGSNLWGKYSNKASD